MIFNTLKMENIRSYEKCRIDFPVGTSLFEGDVGSGKSTILMALEFALFGLGNQKGDALLRKGAKKGSVLLDFSIMDKKYQVKRTLIRNDKDSIRQDKGILGEDGKKIQLSPSEIKERILEILNFKEPPNPRAQSVIFRYAVYTPQEEMKFILSQKPDIRLQTLRKAFGIEDYRIATENAGNISRLLKEQIKYLSGQTADLSSKKNKLKEKEDELTEFKSQLIKYQEEELKIKQDLQKQQSELEKIEEQKSELKTFQAEIPHLERQVKDKSELCNRYSAEIKKAEKENQIKLIPEQDKLKLIEKPSQFSLEKILEKIENMRNLREKREGLKAKLSLLEDNQQNMEKELESWKDKELKQISEENNLLKKDLETANQILKSLELQLQKVEKKIYKLETQEEDLINKLENLDGLGENCPICGSLLDEEHKKNLKTERDKEIRRCRGEITVLNDVKIKGEKQVELKRSAVEKLDKELNKFEILSSKHKAYIDIKNLKLSLIEEISRIDEKLSLDLEFGRVYEDFNQYIAYLERLSQKIKEYEQAQNRLPEVNYQIEKNREKIRDNQKNIKELSSEIKKLRDLLSNYREKTLKMPEILKILAKLGHDCNNIDAQHRSINNQIISTQTNIKNHKGEVVALENEIKEKETLSKQLGKLKDHTIWLNDYMIPTLSIIEKHVMQNIHLDFDDTFKKWFNLLIDDPSKTGKIDEEFTPIVEQDGFQQEINYLSGGEKTSTALAYRLALNNMVQKVSTGMKSNLLIMDEPTDGFSKEQLFKIREILSELKYPQIILVSHERELESFADNIFHIEKADGISVVLPV